MTPGKATKQKEPEAAAGRRITVNSVIVSKNLSKDAVADLARKNAAQLTWCYKGSDFRGTMVLRLLINADGTVKSASLVSSTLNEQAFDQCILEKLRGWRFPSTRDGRGAEVTITLMFVS
jgi:TonB family protein